MKKPISFSDYKILRKMSYNDINRWLVSFYGNAFEDGVREAENAMKPFDVVCELEPEDCASAMSSDDLLELLMSVNGIGKKRAKEILDKILDKGVDYNLWA